MPQFRATENSWVPDGAGPADRPPGGRWFDGINGRRPSEFCLSRSMHMVVVGLIASSLTAGCARPKRRFKPALLVTERDVASYLGDALEHTDADVRRAAIQQISKTRYLSRSTVIDALDLIARTDASESVRCAAIRAIGVSGDPRAADTMLAVLEQHQPKYTANSQQRGDGLRRAAMRVLADHASRVGEPGETVCGTATALFQNDPSRDVRVLAARVLGYCPSAESVRVLIAMLRLRDFGIVHESERALMRLTGMTFEHDPQRWERWLTATDDPFADRGRLDAELDARPRRQWWRLN